MAKKILRSQFHNYNRPTLAIKKHCLEKLFLQEIPLLEVAFILLSSQVEMDLL